MNKLKKYKDFLDEKVSIAFQSNHGNRLGPGYNWKVTNAWEKSPEMEILPNFIEEFGQGTLEKDDEGYYISTSLATGIPKTYMGVRVIQSYRESINNNVIEFEYNENDGSRVSQIIKLNGEKIGYVRYVDDEIDMARIDEPFQRRGYYMEALFDYVRHYQREVWSTPQGRVSESSKGVWKKIEHNTPDDISLRKDDGYYILSPNNKVTEGFVPEDTHSKEEIIFILEQYKEILLMGKDNVFLASGVAYMNPDHMINTVEEITQRWYQDDRQVFYSYFKAFGDKRSHGQGYVNAMLKRIEEPLNSWQQLKDASDFDGGEFDVDMLSLRWKYVIRGVKEFSEDLRFG